MKFSKIISLVLSFTAIATSCTIKESINEPVNEPELPSGEYVRLSLSGGDGTKAMPDTRATWEDPNGKGSLSFKWETVDISSEETKKLALIVSDGTEAITSHENEDGTGDTEFKHTGLAVTPSESDAHYADFETVRYYSTDDLNNAKHFFAVAGAAEVTADTQGGRHICSLDMPASFTQAQDQDPSFLRNYMHMYATAAYSGSNTRLNFNHIPATFRFIINNGSDAAVSVESVSVTTLDGSAVASKATNVIFGWSAADVSMTYDNEGHSAVTTNLSESTIEAGNKYTAYSIALPLASSEAFKGKALNFSVNCSNGETLSSILDGETLAKANGGDIYNWVGGKSYTIKINIGSDGKVTGAVLTNKDITVASNIAGSYTLKYVDDAGEPLADYADICTISIDQMATYEDFIDANVAPYSADAIGIFDAAGVKIGSIVINGLKADNAGLQYSIGMLSDVHIGVDTAEEDFTRALNFFYNVNAEFTCICGDISENGTESEYAGYKTIVDAHSPSKPVYTTTGNHDAKGEGVNVTLWKQYTGQDLTFEVTKGTDHYLFLGMSYWNFSAAYLDSNIKWLENKLEEYRNERCFVITHMFFPDKAGNMNEVYPSYNWLTGTQLTTLQAMRDRYKNTIWFSGHSHWKWSLQQYDDDANICRNPESGWSVHVPSCAKPIDSNGSTREDRVAQSEGAVINVYENHIDILGVDFIAGKYLPIATYRLDTTLQEVEEKEEEVVLDETAITASDFVWNPEKGSMTTDAGTASVTDVPDMPGYIDVIFTGKSQGYYMTNSTFTPGIASPDQTVAINIDDLQCWTGWGTDSQKEVSAIDKVGFYSGSYHLTSTNDCAVYVKTESGKEGQGVQFQTSSSCAGPYPIKIRMKARAQFQTKEEPKNYISADGFTAHPQKPGGTVINTVGMENYVDVTFTGTSQGFYIKNDTHFDASRSVKVTVEDVKALNNGVEVEIPSNVGFYQESTGEYLIPKPTESRIIELKDGNGLPFQTRSKYSGPTPITIRMKVVVEFN